MNRFVTDWVPRGIHGMEDGALVAVGTTNRSSLIIAGPGAGKTEMLAQRASFLLETGICAAPKRILAISFKRDAAYNLQDRVKLRCGLELSQQFDSKTYAGWAKGLLDRFRMALPLAYRPTPDYEIVSLDNPQTFRDHLLDVVGKADFDSAKIRNMTDKQLKTAFQLRVLDEGIKSIVSNSQPTLIQCWWERVLHGQKQSLLSFSMIEVLAELILQTNPKLVAALRAAYSFVFLDEFQDTTRSQYKILETAFKSSSAILTAVGDNKQCIMRWAGANTAVFDEFTVAFNAQRYELINNYRSAPKLVQIQEHLIKAFDPKSPVPRAINSNESGEGECRILTFLDYTAEAAYLGNLIKKWIDEEGVKPANICVIARQTREGYTAELLRQLKIKKVRARIQDKFQNLLTEPLTLAVIDSFKLCSVLQNPESWNSLLNLVFRLRGVSNTEEGTQKARKIAGELGTFIEVLRNKLATANYEDDIYQMILQFVDFLGKTAFCKVYEQYIQSTFIRQIARECARELMAARRLSASWAAAIDDFLGVDTVPIMTIHKSKGLEYHTVVFIGLEDSPFFGYRDGNDAEENCNFFVAFSRAKKRVIFTFAGIRPNQWRKELQVQQRVKVSGLYELLQNAGISIEEIS